MELGYISDKAIVLDGGLATELEARGHNLSDELWSARLLADAPGEIVAAHLAFFRAGAAIATTASYQASFGGFAAKGIGRSEAARLLRCSVELADSARAQAPGERKRWIAASVGPYGASLADGSEYRGRYGLSIGQLVRFHRPRLETLAEAGPDMLALETVPDVDEGAALVEATEGIGIPAWLSYTITGERTRAGQRLEEAFSVAMGTNSILAIGINCCVPADVDFAVATAREVTGKPVVVYPNSGEGWDPGRREWAGISQYSPAEATRWVHNGARIVGGCCRVSPEDIAALAQSIPPSG